MDAVPCKSTERAKCYRHNSFLSLQAHPASVQIVRSTRVRKPPVAFWACQRAVIDPQTGLAAVDAPFQDHLLFGQPTIKLENGSKCDTDLLDKRELRRSLVSWLIKHKPCSKSLHRFRLPN